VEFLLDVGLFLFFDVIVFFKIEIS